MTEREPLTVVVAGPTASGKSALALDIAEQLDGEIVCADSRQIYAGLRIASAGPSPDDERRARHHLYGSVDAAVDKMNAGRFTRVADDVIDAIHARGKRAILVGGTGLYLRAWRVGLDEDPAERDMAALIARPARRPAVWILVDASLTELEPRILARARAMFSAGIVDEARALAARLPPEHALLHTFGVAEALAVSRGDVSVDDAVRATALRTRQYARRQRTWFKKEPWWSRVALADTTRAVALAQARPPT